MESVGRNVHVKRDYATSHLRSHKFYSTVVIHKNSADAESVSKDLPKASWPQAILEFQLPNSLDYRVYFEPQSHGVAIKPRSTETKMTKRVDTSNTIFKIYAYSVIQGLLCCIYSPG